MKKKITLRHMKYEKSTNEKMTLQVFNFDISVHILVVHICDVALTSAAPLSALPGLAAAGPLPLPWPGWLLQVLGSLSVSFETMFTKLLAVSS